MHIYLGREFLVSLYRVIVREGCFPLFSIDGWIAIMYDNPVFEKGCFLP